MTAAAERLQELNLTNEELERLTEAFKKEEFRKLFLEYAEEISNPENRAQYENEIRQLENERGMDVKFINPEPGYVIKTTLGGKTKAFINICKSELIGKPSSTKKVGSDGRQGLSWSLPHSFSPPREDMSRNKDKCQVYDVVIHPDTYRMAESNSRFKKMVNDMAIEGICKQFDVELDTKNIKFPKMKYKGTVTPTVLRTRLSGDAAPKKQSDPDDILNSFPYPYDNQTSEEKALQRQQEIDERQAKKAKAKEKIQEVDKKVETENEYAIPKYSITHRSVVDMQDYVDSPNVRTDTRPTALVIEIFLPLLSSAAPVQLDIFEKQLKLVSDKPAKYKLAIDLPYLVDESQGSAKFDKARRKLLVTLPVVPFPAPSPHNNEDVTESISDAATNDVSHPGSGNANEEVSDEVDACTRAKPLIEVISSHNVQSSAEVGRCNDDVDELLETEVSATFGDADVVHGQSGESTADALSVYDSLNADYILPVFDCEQDLNSLTFRFHINRVRHENTSLSLTTNHSCQLRMVSVGDGGYPVLYRFCLKFHDDCFVASHGWSVTSSANMVTLLVVKDETSYGIWNPYWVGLSLDCLEVGDYLL
jgi:dynein assembly factor 2